MRFINMLPVTDQTCYLVKHLELQPHQGHNVTDDDIAEILPDCPNIETIILTGVPDLSDRSLVLLATHATALKYVDVSGCRHITDVGVAALHSHARSLKSVRLNHVPLITDPAISDLALSLSHLEEFELCDSSLITAVSVRDIWTFAKRLRRLKLARCSQLTDKAFPYAFQPSPIIQTRRLSGISLEQYSLDATTAPLERPQTWLEELPPLILPATYTLEELRLLDLTNCYQLTDDAIIGITTHAPRIQTLLLTGCIRLTDRALESMTKLSHHLDVLTMAHIDNITDRGISALCGACIRIRSIDISYCSLLTDLTVLELGSLSELNRLCATNIPSITDNAVLFLAEHAPHLADLHLSYCPNISLEAVHTLILRLTVLEQLSVSGIPSMKRKGVRKFSESAPIGYEERLQGPYRVYKGNMLDELRFFLEEEESRRREAERLNVLFFQRGDERQDLY
ncbi:hypothetical protein BXZ70DRAFT_344105 [Cristinia sonorae]|uniref:F-box/LRR-repeat protein 15-like leucin rich repeat domain-containing protein n=1 Tax=Cristinia sonorae TaxID=1940300 RepID=A0A8K0UL01_9AGAR|nr:hypothetical protein BXZ70DRAFT_344105 [Cristinia sonorae]